MQSHCNCVLAEGEKPHPMSYRGCIHVKELQRRRAQRAPKGFSGRTFFSKFTSPQQSYAAALCQDTHHQEPQVPQTYGKSFQTPVQQHLPQQKIQKTGASVQAPSQLTMTCNATDHDRAQWSCVRKRQKMVITKMALNWMKQNGCYSQQITQTHSI
jgi:hypothetical protein